jgi:hypothetical protein
MRTTIAILAAGAGLMLIPGQANAQSGNRDCRDVTTSEGGRARVVKMCRDSDGQFRPIAARGGALAPNFRGKIVYQGNYDGAEIKRARPMRKVTVANLINAAGGSAEEPYQGTATYSIEYDGNLVSGRWEMFDGRRRIGGKLTGTRRGSTCELFDEAQAPMVATCDAGVFRGSSKSAPSARAQWRTDFDAAATETVDFVERDRMAAASRAEAAEKARVARAAELAERARLRAALPRGAVARYQPLLDNAVIADSAHWFSNRYSAGSIDLVGIQNDKQSGAVFLKAYFKYSSGREGWVGAIVRGQRVQCLQFWDDPSGCRGIGDGANAKMAQGFIEGMLSPGGGSPANGKNDYPDSCGLVVTGTNAAGGAVYGSRC